MPALRIRSLLIPLACAAALTIVTTWPLAVSTGKVLDWCDVLYSAWVQAWGTHALTTAPASLPDANVFWPARGALFYGPAGLGALPWFAPVYLVTRDPIRSLNIAFLVCLTLTGASLHWVVWRWRHSHAAGVVAAATLLTAPWVAKMYVPLVPHTAALQFFPLVVYLASSDLPRRRDVVALAVLTFLQCLTDLVYVAPAVLAPLAALAAIRILRPATRRGGLRLAAAVLGATAGLAPLLRGYARAAAAPEIADQTLWRTPAAVSRLPLLLVGPTPAGLRATVVVIIALGVVLALLRRHGMRRMLRSRAWRNALFWFAAGFTLALGMRVEWGSVSVPAPQGLLAAWLPAVERLRVPSRLGVAALVGLALTTGLAFAAIELRLRRAIRERRRARAWVAALTVLAATCLQLDAGPLLASATLAARSDFVPPPAALLDVLRRTKGPLVEVPSRMSGPLTEGGPRLSGALAFAYAQARAMIDSTYHWHPVLNGYSSYFPSGFAKRMALVDRLPDAAAVASLARSAGLRFVWVHLDRLDSRQRARWLAGVAADQRSQLRLVARQDDELLFAIDR